MKTKIITYLKPVVQWMSDHPLKSCAFTFFFTILACLTAICSATDHNGEAVVYAAIYLVTAIVLPFIMRRDTRKKIITILLAVCLFALSLPARAEEPPPTDDPKPIGWGAAAVVVIVIGGIAYVYLRRFCQRHLNRPPAPPETNAEPTQVIGRLSPAALDGSFAATRTYYYWLSCDSSISAAGIPAPMTAMELTGTFQQTTNGLELRLDPRKLDAAQELVDSWEFDRLLAEHGVRIGNGIDQQFFGRNGRPATQADVPIYFSTGDDGRSSFSVGRTVELHTVIMERSPDLKNWEELTTARISAGQQLRFVDATASSQMFYRFR